MPDGRWSTRFGSYEYACKDLPREHALRVSAAAGRIVKGSIASVLVACKPGSPPTVRYAVLWEPHWLQLWALSWQAQLGAVTGQHGMWRYEALLRGALIVCKLGFSLTIVRPAMSEYDLIESH